MISTSTMHQIEPYSNLHFNSNETHLIQQEIPSNVFKLFDWSIHNCLCKRTKTGLVFYPKDNQMRNIILLVCDQCYNYNLNNDTQHIQLEKWYFNIYKDSKIFHFKSRFSQDENGSFCFNSIGLNTNDSFNIKERELESWEKDAIQWIVQKKFDTKRI